MLALLSPSKTLDMNCAVPIGKATTPALLEQTQLLIAKLQSLSEGDLKKMMGISDKLAELNHARFQSFSVPFTEKNSKQALQMFKGHVYEGLDSGSFTREAWEEAQKSVRILSGLYGLLRPMDMMQPYRLEMGTKLASARGKNLYQFWGDYITEEINRTIEENGHELVVNLASEEYYKAVNPKKLNARVVNITFKEQREDGYKTIGLFAKQARGLMARYIVTQHVYNIDHLRHFSEAGYQYNPTMSTGSEILFVRRKM